MLNLKEIKFSKIIKNNNIVYKQKINTLNNLVVIEIELEFDKDLLY